MYIYIAHTSVSNYKTASAQLVLDLTWGTLPKRGL